MKKIFLLVISLCWLFVKPISSQTNYSTNNNVEQSSGTDIFTDEELNEIFNYNSCHIIDVESSFHEGLARFSLDGYQGFIDKQGQVVIPAQYIITDDFHEGLVFVWMGHLGERKGMFIDRTGNKVIETSSPLAGEFHEGLACIEQKDSWGFVNKQGNMVIPCRYYLSGVYDKCYFSDGLACVKRNNLWGFVNKQGQEVISLKYDDASPFSEGLACVEKGEKWGFINKQGQIVIPLEYDMVYPFSEGLACVKKGEKWGFINKQGQIVIPLEYDDVKSFSEGYAAVEKKNDWGYIDKSGRVVIPLKYFNAFPFSEGYARVDLSDIKELDDKESKIFWCYTSRKTGKLVRTDYYLEDLEDLLSLYSDKSDIRFIDKNGKICFPNVKSEKSFHEGYALVLKNKNKIFMSNKGELFDVKIDAASLYNVGKIQENSYNSKSNMDYLKRALSNYYKSANLGNLSACFKLGYYYYSGIGFRKNYAEAVKWLEKSLPINNNGDNYRYLAYCYYSGGNGIEKNESKAFNCFMEGAKTGNEYCEYGLAVCYRNGYGCQADIEKACKYLDLAYPKNKSFYANVYLTYYNELTYYYLKKKDNNNALISIEKAIAASPNDVRLYDSKGEVLMNMGRVKEAVEIWHKILNLEPRFLEYYPEGTEFYNQLKAKGLI